MRLIWIRRPEKKSQQSCGRPGVPRNCGQENPRSPQKHYTYRNKNLSARGGYAQLLVQHGALGARFHKRYLHSSEKSFQARKRLSSTCTYLLPTGMACSFDVGVVSSSAQSFVLSYERSDRVVAVLDVRAGGAGSNRRGGADPAQLPPRARAHLQQGGG